MSALYCGSPSVVLFQSDVLVEGRSVESYEPTHVHLLVAQLDCAPDVQSVP